MDCILQKIITETSGKFQLAGNAAKEAFDAVIAQQGNNAYEMHQLREKCLTAIELALDSKSSRLVRLATDALQFMLRDNQLHSLDERNENIDETLPMQVVHTLHDLPSWSHDSDLQCHCFTILLQLTSSSAWSIDSHVICKIVQLCISTFTASDQLSTRMAARATVIQAINSFCTKLYKNDDGRVTSSPKGQQKRSSYSNTFQEVTKLMNYCCSKLKVITSSPQESPPLLLMLDAVHAILSSQEEGIRNCNEFVEILWKEFAPIVINVLGDPDHMDLLGTCTSDHSSNRGRGLGAVAGDQVIFGAPEVAKSAYRICDELLRLLGSVPSMHSVLEALFHRFLLFPPADKRLDALKILKTILENPRRIVDLGFKFCQPFNEATPQNVRSELTLWQIILDCLVDCTMQTNVEISTMALRCTAAFIISLTELCEENANFLREEFVVEINRRFARLADADIDGVDYSSLREKYPFDMKTVCTPTVENDQHIYGKSSTTDQTIETVSNTEEDIASSTDDTIDRSLKSIAGRVGASLRSTNDSIEEDSVAIYLDRIRSAWDANMNPKSHQHHATLQRCTSFDKRELEAAAEFVEELESRLPDWNNLMSTIEYDSAVQTFAAETCKKLMLTQLKLLQEHGSMYEAAIYNSDALYLITYACLNLCQSIFLNKKLDTSESPYTIVSQCKFMESVTNTGTIAYVSLSFIDAVYSRLIETDIFEEAKIAKPSVVFSDLIKDYNGVKGELLSDYVKLERLNNRKSLSSKNLAAIKFARRLISSSWNGIVEILSVLIDRANESNVLPTLSLNVVGVSSKKSGRIADGILASLDGLQRLLILCPKLEMKNKCAWIFRKLVEASCPLEELRGTIQREQEKGNGFSVKLASLVKTSCWEIQTPHALSMELILDNAIQIASGDPSCWNPVVRCIEYVCEFEHRYFTSGANSSRSFFTSKSNGKDGGTTAAKSSTSKRRNGNKAETKFDVDEDDYVISMPFSPVQTVETVLAAIEQIDGKQTAVNGSVLSDRAVAKILCVLSFKIDRFYEDCCRCLNMAALKEFLKCLVSASQSNLFYGAASSRGRLPAWSLLERLGTVLNRIARSGRPLVHLMTIWGVAAPHFIEAACSNNTEMTCRTIDFLRESVSALLDSGADLHNFHFNESLFQPFQTILCLELCGEETFDRIVCAIAELVECYKKEIHTGWKSLFGALKAVRCSYVFSKQQMSAEDLKHLHNAVVDVFSCFLKSDNLKVFCRASGECISCLLRFLTDDDLNTDNDLINIENDETGFEVELQAPTPDFAKTALCFLRQCHTLLVNLYIGPTDDIVVHLLRRLTPKDHSLQGVDSDLPNLHHSNVLPSLATFLSDQQTLFGWDLSPFFLEHRLEEPSYVIPWADFPVGKQLVCEAWVDLIEGLVGSIATCPGYLQPEVIDSVYSIVGTMLKLPGLTFGAYCLNHLVLPMLQRWLRRESSSATGWRENKPSVRNFKQCLGLTVETVVQYLDSDTEAPCNHLLLSQAFDLLIECVSTPSEVVARLGCSSLRHVIQSLKQRLTPKLWDVVCRCLWKVGTVTLHPIRMLMTYFSVGSHRYAGDLGTVQVAIRKDSNPVEAARFRALAQQVFLVDNQKYEENLEDHPDKLSQSYRSVVFLLNPSDANSSDNVIRLPFRNVVFGLLSHQLWLQLIGTILGDGTNIKLTSFSSTLTRHIYSADNTKKRLSGCLEFLTNEQVCSLLLCLDASFLVSYEFDRRPGLKFLIQKVFSSPVSSNLYKQAVTCWTFKAITLYQLASGAILEPANRIPTKQLKEISDDETLVDCSELPMQDLAKIQSRFYVRLMCRSYLALCQSFVDVESVLIGGESHADRLASHTLDVVLPISHDVRADADEMVQRNATPNSSASASASSTCVSSPNGTPVKTARLAATVEEGETIYTLASTDVVQGLLKDYKRRKVQQTMGSNAKQQVGGPSSVDSRKNPFDESLAPKADVSNHATMHRNRDDETSCEDMYLRKESIDSMMKDGEAACLAWSEMGVSLLQLVLALPDDQFRLMLPTVFQPAALMTSRSNSLRVKLASTDLLYRLAEMFKIFD